MKCPYMPVRYVEYYTDIPASPRVQYVIRERYDDVVLEKYYHNDCEILAEYNPLALTNDNLQDTLLDAREIIGKRHLLWVCKCKTP